MLASKALLDCKTLTLTELGRNLPTSARTKHNIKRIDRLLGNTHLHQERLALYQWHASFIYSGNPMPIVLVDWSDIREHKRLMALRASIAFKGRSVTLYEKSYPLSVQCAKAAHKVFLADSARILPSHVTPVMVTDAGFKVPGHEEVEAHGWCWLSRLRGTVQFAFNLQRIGAENWCSVRSTHHLANGRARSLGCKTLTKTNPINCHFALYRGQPKGRKNQRSTRTNCHHPSAKTYSTSAREPWVLATNLPLSLTAPNSW